MQVSRIMLLFASSQNESFDHTHIHTFSTVMVWNAGYNSYFWRHQVLHKCLPVGLSLAWVIELRKIGICKYTIYCLPAKKYNFWKSKLQHTFQPLILKMKQRNRKIYYEYKVIFAFIMYILLTLRLYYNHNTTGNKFDLLTSCTIILF